MKLIKLYESVLSEGRLEACVAQFGQELFSTEHEDNTDFEDEFIELLTKYDGESAPSNITSELQHLAGRLKRCVAAYPDVIKSSGNAYKGIRIKLKDLFQSYPTIKNRLRTGQPFEMIYKGRNKVQTWTEDSDHADDEFGRAGIKLDSLLDKFEKARDNNNVEEFIKYLDEGVMETKIPIIIHYRVSADDFMFRGKFFSYLNQDDDNDLIRINDRPITVMAKVFPANFSSRLFDMLETITTWKS